MITLVEYSDSQGKLPPTGTVPVVITSGYGTRPGTITEIVRDWASVEVTIVPGDGDTNVGDHEIIILNDPTIGVKLARPNDPLSDPPEYKNHIYGPNWTNPINVEPQTGTSMGPQGYYDITRPETRGKNTSGTSTSREGVLSNLGAPRTRELLQSKSASPVGEAFHRLDEINPGECFRYRNRPSGVWKKISGLEKNENIVIKQDGTISVLPDGTKVVYIPSTPGGFPSPPSTKLGDLPPGAIFRTAPNGKLLTVRREVRKSVGGWGHTEPGYRAVVGKRGSGGYDETVMTDQLPVYIVSDEDATELTEALGDLPVGTEFRRIASNEILVVAERPESWDREPWIQKSHENDVPYLSEGSTFTRSLKKTERVFNLGNVKTRSVKLANDGAADDALIVRINRIRAKGDEITIVSDPHLSKGRLRVTVERNGQREYWMWDGNYWRGDLYRKRAPADVQVKLADDPEYVTVRDLVNQGRLRVGSEYWWSGITFSYLERVVEITDKTVTVSEVVRESSTGELDYSHAGVLDTDSDESCYRVIDTRPVPGSTFEIQLVPESQVKLAEDGDVFWRDLPVGTEVLYEVSGRSEIYTIITWDEYDTLPMSRSDFGPIDRDDWVPLRTSKGQSSLVAKTGEISKKSWLTVLSVPENVKLARELVTVDEITSPGEYEISYADVHYDVNVSPSSTPPSVLYIEVQMEQTGQWDWESQLIRRFWANSYDELEEKIYDAILGISHQSKSLFEAELESGSSGTSDKGIKLSAAVEVREKTTVDKIWYCPYCGEKIQEKSLYRDPEGNWFHRPCIDQGPIELPERETQLLYPLLSPEAGEWWYNQINGKSSATAVTAVSGSSQFHGKGVITPNFPSQKATRCEGTEETTEDVNPDAMMRISPQSVTTSKGRTPAGGRPNKIFGKPEHHF